MGPELPHPRRGPALLPAQRQRRLDGGGPWPREQLGAEAQGPLEGLDQEAAQHQAPQLHRAAATLSLLLSLDRGLLQPFSSLS